MGLGFFRRFALRSRAAVLLGLVFGACSARRRVEQPLTVLVASAPVALFPNTVNEDLTLSVLGNVYETLVDVDPSLKLRPGLAESWYTADATTWVFRLRRGIALHDHRILRAQDVVASLDHARNDPSSRRRGQLSAVEKISAPDDHTVVIKTDHPFNALPMRLANVFVWAPGPGETAVGTGPYDLTASGPQETVLEAFTGYVPPAKIPRIVFRAVPDVAERVQVLERGEGQFMIDVPGKDLARLRAHFTTKEIGGLRILVLGLSCKATNENPFRDVRARRAAALAIDRETLIDKVGGHAQVVDEITSPGELGGRHVTLTAPRADPGAAIALLREAGLERGFEVELDYSVKHRNLEPMLEELSRELARVGIKVKPHLHPAQEYQNLIENASPGMYLLSWLSLTGDGRISYEYLLHSRSLQFGVDNASSYSSKEMDGLIEDASRPATSDGLEAIFEQMAQKVTEDVPLVPLLRLEDLYVFSPKLAFTPRLDRRLRFRDAQWM